MFLKLLWAPKVRKRAGIWKIVFSAFVLKNWFFMVFRWLIRLQKDIFWFRLSSWTRIYLPCHFLPYCLPTRVSRNHCFDTARTYFCKLFTVFSWGPTIDFFTSFDSPDATLQKYTSGFFKVFVPMEKSRFYKKPLL